MTYTYDIYADDVINNRVTVCNYIKQAVTRYISFKKKYNFREDKVQEVINFISKLKHFSGAVAGKPFLLEPWQQWIIANIFGFYRDNGRRLTRTVYLEVGRKNGKSSLLAAIQLYMFVCGEAGAEVDYCANSAKQASISFQMTSKYLRSIDSKCKYFQRYRDSIKFPKADSIINVFASDADKLDGYSPSSFLLDEMHEMKDSKLYDVLVSGQGFRENPLACMTTTAGFNKFGFCYNFRKICLEILAGVTEKDNMFAAIYTIDDTDNWQDHNVWLKANPNLGVSVQVEFIGDQIESAIQNPSLEISVKTKNLNMWVDSAETWIPYEDLLKCVGDVKRDMFDKETYCYVGVDLSSVSDLTAVSVLIPYNGKLYYKTFYYLPQETVYNSPNSQLYQQWQRQKFLTVTPGNVIDYDYITADIKRISEYFIIDKIGYDPYNSTNWAIQCTSEGMPMEPYSQSLLNFNAPTKELERQIKLGNVVMDNNPITLWCFANAVLKIDHNENMKPVKEIKEQKIDGTIAMIEALGIYQSQPNYSNEIMAIPN